MGDNIYLGDRNGVRTPMQWSADRNAGFSRANPQRLYLPVIIDPEYHYEAVNVEAQQQNRARRSWWMKRLIALRKRYQAFGRGTHRVPLSREPPGPGFCPPLARRDHPHRSQSVALRSVRRDSICREFKEACPSSCSARPSFRQSATCPTSSPSGRTAFTGSSSRPHTAAAPRAADEAQLPSLEVAGAWEHLITPAPSPAGKNSPGLS